jgi:hypothetical protein
MSRSILTTSDQFCVNSWTVTVYTVGYFITTYNYIYLIITGSSVWLSFRQIKRLNNSDFHKSAVWVIARLACYAAHIRNWLPTFGTTFRSRLQQPSMLTLEDGTDSSSRKSVTIYQPKTWNIPEQRRPQYHWNVFRYNY